MIFSIDTDDKQKINGNSIMTMFEKSYQKVYRTAFVITSDREIAKDATQEAFLKAFQRIETLRDKSKFESWICSIVSNICKDMLIKKNKLKDKNIALYDNEDNVKHDIKEINAYVIPEAAFENKELKHELHKCINELALDEQQIIFLRFYNNFSYEQISKYMNLKKGTVKSKVHRAKEKILKKLKNYFNGKGK